MLHLQTLSRMLFLIALVNFFFGCGLNAEKNENEDAKNQKQADAVQPEIDSNGSVDKNTGVQGKPKEDLAKEAGKDSDGKATDDEATNEEATDDEADDSDETDEDEDSSQGGSSDLISQILPLLSGKSGTGGVNAGMLTSLLGGGSSSGGLGFGQITALLGAGNGSAGASSASSVLSGLSNNQLKTLLGQLKP